MGTLSKRELDPVVEEAIVDTYDEYETVTSVDEVPGPGIATVCRQGKEQQRIGILDLPLPSPPPAGPEWIAAYRHWLTRA